MQPPLREKGVLPGVSHQQVGCVAQPGLAFIEGWLHERRLGHHKRVTALGAAESKLGSN